jgi:hypothetical protein
MWQCPNCSEPIEDTFDVCWQCGTGRDGSRPVDLAAENPPQEPDGRLLNERLVEVCSASDLIEAEAICGALEEAGIRAKVVGEGPGVAAGGLPIVEEVAPQVWVREEDAARAQEVIGRWRETHPRRY